MSEPMNNQHQHPNGIIRLCHICGHVNEAEKEILKCEGCAKPFLPITSFCELLKRVTQSGPPPSGKKVTEQVGGQGNQISGADRDALFLSIPIHGLVVFW